MSNIFKKITLKNSVSDMGVYFALIMFAAIKTLSAPDPILFPSPQRGTKRYVNKSTPLSSFGGCPVIIIGVGDTVPPESQPKTPQKKFVNSRILLLFIYSGCLRH